MIPEFNHSQVLPPFLGDRPLEAARVSPYVVSMLEVANRFARSAPRRRLLDGLLRYRADLATLGFLRGFQWVDGSFTEDIEGYQNRSPADIDLVTFAYSPANMSSEQIADLLNGNPDLFQPDTAREKYGCDAYVLPLDKSPVNLVKRVTYYFNLFSHRRSDHVWKGLLQIPLASDDQLARELLQNVSSGDHDAVTT